MNKLLAPIILKDFWTDGILIGLTVQHKGKEYPYTVSTEANDAIEINIDLSIT